MEWIEENGWEVLNRNKQGEEGGKWTYIGSRVETVIDYGIMNKEAWERVEEFRIEEKVESDHEERGQGKAREEQKKVIIKVWDEQRVEEYSGRLETATFVEQDVEKMAAELKEVIEKATTKKEVTVRGTKGAGRKNGWWDRECE
jgi:hypothetical protein